MRWIYAKNGQWRAIDAAAVPEVLDLTPGAESSTTAWLGVVHTGDVSSVVRLDISPGLTSIVLVSTKITCSGEAAMVPDDEGRVWLACSGVAGLTLRRVHKLDDKPDSEIAVGKMPEPPVYVFHAPLRTYVLTAHGFAEVRTSGPVDWIELLPQTNDDSSGRIAFDSLGPSFRRSAISVPATWTIMSKRDFALPPSRSPGPAFFLDVSGGRASISPLSKWPAAAWFARTSAQPAAMIWSEERSASIEWFKADPGQLTSTFAEILPELSGAEDAVRSETMLAVTDGSRVATRSLPPNIDDFHAPLYVPASLVIRYRNGKSDAFNLIDRFPPENLPAGAASVELRVSPDYEDWWRGGLASAEYRSSANGAWEHVEVNGRAIIPLQPGRQYRIGARPRNLPSRDFSLAF